MQIDREGSTLEFNFKGHYSTSQRPVAWQRYPCNTTNNMETSSTPPTAKGELSGYFDSDLDPVELPEYVLSKHVTNMQ